MTGSPIRKRTAGGHPPLIHCALFLVMGLAVPRLLLAQDPLPAQRPRPEGRISPAPRVSSDPRSAVIASQPRSLRIDGPDQVDEASSATFTVVARFGDGSENSVTPQWSIEPNLSPPAQPASISSSGVLSAPRIPWEWPVTLRATYAAPLGTVAASKEVIIRDSSGRLIGVQIEGPNEVVVGQSADYRAYATYDDGFRYNVTAHTGFYGGWKVVRAPPEVTIDGAGRVAVAGTAPDTTFQVQTAFGIPDGATYTGQKYVRVRSWYLTIEGPTEVLEGDPEQVMAEGSARYQLVLHEADGSRRQVTAESWSVMKTDRSSTSILNDGTLWTFGVATGGDDVEIHATHTHEGVRKRTLLPVKIVDRVILTGIQIVPPAELDPALGVKTGSTYTFRIRASFDSRSDLETATADWSIDPAVPGSSITSGGRLEAGPPGEGDLQIRAIYAHEGISRSASFSVPWMPVTRITIQPPATSLQPLPVRDDQTAQFRARAYFADGTVVDVIPQWSLSRTDVATISAAGLLTPRLGASQTPLDVTATYGSGGRLTASWAVFIVPRRILAFRMVPADDPIVVREGQTVQLRAEVEWEGGTVEPVPAQWTEIDDRYDEISLTSDGRLTGRWPTTWLVYAQAGWAYAGRTYTSKRRVSYDCPPPPGTRRITLPRFEMTGQSGSN